MAFSPPLPDKTKQEIRRLRKAGLSVATIAEKLGLSIGVVSNYSRDIGSDKHTAKRAKVVEAVNAGWSIRKIMRVVGTSQKYILKVIEGMEVEAGPVENPFADDFDDSGIPEPHHTEYKPFEIGGKGRYGVISDIHIPCHDKTVLSLFVKKCKAEGVKGVILNGDTLDSHEVSRHDRDPSLPRYVQEIAMAKDFLAWLRQQLPKADIYWKHGNHEERIQPYIFSRAPALEGLEGVNLESWLHFQKFGVQLIEHKRIVHLGKLHVIHGHEYKGGGGVNPARWLYLRAGSVALCSHFHRTSEHHERRINMKYEAAWSIGCACNLHPSYAPINNWNHGFCFVDLDNDGGFAVENNRVFEGRVV